MRLPCHVMGAAIRSNIGTVGRRVGSNASFGMTQRSFAIYAVGEGWTGALTRKYVMETIHGHFDEDEEINPVMIYPGDDVQQASAGWGSSTFLDTEGQVKIVGRSQDLMNLLRLNRMPDQVRKWANQSLDPSDTTIVGTFISKLIGLASGGDEQEVWDSARQYSITHDWTAIDLSRIGDDKMTHVSTSAGFMAMIGKSGTLYCMGINNRGQCGTGAFSNNVWTPEKVVGVTSTKKLKTEGSKSDQEEPVVEVALGFQQGYALTKSGNAYSWGKANRGQLGRQIDTDQDCTAGPIAFDGQAVSIAAGMHHGALLGADNKVYVWGKNMGVSDDDKNKPVDVILPEPVNGLPSSKVSQIACGSHHTAILMDDGSVHAVGIASDEAVQLREPVLLLEKDIASLPINQFTAHHDRTTIIDNDGHVFQAHLWKNEDLREHAAFTPSFVDALLDSGETIKSVHRGWLHTIILTEKKS